MVVKFHREHAGRPMTMIPGGYGNLVNLLNGLSNKL
jgi:hypothetical protein